MNPYPRRDIINTVFSSKPQPIWRATLEGEPELLGQSLQTREDAIYDLVCQKAEREADHENHQQQEQAQS